MADSSNNLWYDDDSFWVEGYPVMFSEDRFDSAEEHAKKLVDLIQPGGKNVLDLCCGPGRYAIPLAKMGYTVTGVDRTSYYLNKARARARRAKVKVSWFNKDMRSPQKAGVYDLAINMGSSFGYFEDKSDDLLVLRNLYESLRPGGKVLIHNYGKEVYARLNQPVQSLDLPNGNVLFQRVSVIDDWTRLREEWYLFDGQASKKYSFVLKLYSGQEMRDLLELAGFVDIKLYGNLDGDEYGSKAWRLVSVGRKPI